MPIWAWKNAMAAAMARAFAVPGEGTMIHLRGASDASLGPVSQPGETLREIVWAVTDRDALKTIADELTRDREVSTLPDGRIRVLGPDGLPVSFQVTQARHVLTRR